MKLDPALKRLGLFVLLLWGSTGCYVPIEQVPPGSREYFPAGYSDFSPDLATRADVLLAMGEPDTVSIDESVLTYRWHSTDGIVVITQCTPPIELTSETTLSFSFDEDGVLRDVNITTG
jgi:hypothetical protein